MSSSTAQIQLDLDNDHGTTLHFAGDWVEGSATPEYLDFRPQLLASAPNTLVLSGEGLGEWDSIFMAFLLQLCNDCRERDISIDSAALPASAHRLLQVATAVKPHKPPEEDSPPLLATLNPVAMLKGVAEGTRDSLAFMGEVTVALGRLAVGKANTRFSDFLTFCYQAGPNAFAIISLTSVLVGMILAYLGAVQLQQFGAEIYVADLVVIGMLREMGALMTAIVMAGRTGAAYAAQLGTMQTNEEVDAISTMGISPVEFLVVPRMLALVAMMPLLTIYANILGIVGGGIVAGGMGITPLQYINAGEAAIDSAHILVGMLKSFVFAVLIAVAGCRSGINSGRSSAAVGQAATEAVVTAVVYLIIADAAINILFQQLGI